VHAAVKLSAVHVSIATSFAPVSMAASFAPVSTGESVGLVSDATSFFASVPVSVVVSVVVSDDMSFEVSCTEPSGPASMSDAGKVTSSSHPMAAVTKPPPRPRNKTALLN
jgi:hypothetical protein